MAHKLMLTRVAWKAGRMDDRGGREIVNAKFTASWVSQSTAPHSEWRRKVVVPWAESELVVGDIWTLTEPSPK